MERNVIPWADFKAQLDAKDPSFQELSKASDYSLWFDEGFTRYYCVIPKDSGADQTDYEANYQSKGNLPQRVLPSPFAANTVEFAGDAIVNASCPVSTATNLDLQMSETLLLNGGTICTMNATMEDWIEAHVVDVDGLAYPAGTVLKTWIKKWGICPDNYLDLTTPQAGKVPSGMYLRVIYHAGTGTDRKVSVNYRLNRQL